MSRLSTACPQLSVVSINGLISRAVSLTAAAAIMMWAWRTILPHKQVQCDINLCINLSWAPASAVETITRT